MRVTALATSVGMVPMVLPPKSTLRLPKLPRTSFTIFELMLCVQPNRSDWARAGTLVGYPAAAQSVHSSKVKKLPRLKIYRAVSVSLPSCRSSRFTKLNWCTGAERERFTLPKSTPVHDPTSIGVLLPGVTVGLPAEIPNGPSLLNVVRFWLPGKHPANWARPAGVGVRPP